MTLEIATVDLGSADWDPLVHRSAAPDPDIVQQAAAIVAEVGRSGDEALTEMGRKYGGSLADGALVVPPSAIRGSSAHVPEALRTALTTAIDNVTTVHAPQRPVAGTLEPVPGVQVERVWSPIGSVGVYVPGGRAVYPSSLIMGVVPARVAGVERIAVATPARADGTIDPVVLAAADLLGIDEMYAMGGAHAIGALAHGTNTVARVDTIVGPGGPWVTAAKLAVLGMCGIDLPAGPSEAIVVADETADPHVVAADVMCQAEHGDESSIVLVTTDRTLADRVRDEITGALGNLGRGHIIRRALETHGLIAIADDLAQGLRFANAWAPEHLSIHTASPRTDADAVPNAGSVFVGHWTPEAAGDYATGANHVLPTGGLARSHGPLGVEDFGSWRQIQTATRDGLASLAPTITELARAEGFGAHAESVLVRLAASP
jgi:histidinol dehydrogenase